MLEQENISSARKTDHTREALLLALLIAVFDQFHKYYMLEIFKIAERGVVRITDFFQLVMVWNPGVSFGMFRDTPYGHYIFSAIAIIVTLLLLFWLFKTEKRFQAVALGIIIGGAVGNIIDRIRFGRVADFFDFYIGKYHWPAFNIADAAVTIGAIMLLIDGFFFCKRTENRKKKLENGN